MQLHHRREQRGGCIRERVLRGAHNHEREQQGAQHRGREQRAILNRQHGIQIHRQHIGQLEVCHWRQRIGNFLIFDRNHCRLRVWQS